MNTHFSASGTAYTLNGPANAPTVVLIHGLGLQLGMWTPYIQALKSDFRVISYDFPGHGASAPFSGEETLRTLSTQLIDLLDELRIERASLVGFSLGGMINRRLALDYPDRVDRLVILNSPHERSAALQARVESFANQSSAGGPAATLDAALARWFSPPAIAQNLPIIDRVTKWVLSCPAQDYAACRRILAFGVLELIRPNPAITHPALVMTSEHDEGSTPAMAQAIADEIDGAQLEIIQSLRHLGLIEHPAPFIKAVHAFLLD